MTRTFATAELAWKVCYVDPVNNDMSLSYLGPRPWNQNWRINYSLPSVDDDDSHFLSELVAFVPLESAESNCQ
jgi:hypothetical protein